MREGLGLILLALLLGTMVVVGVRLLRRARAEREFRRGHSDYSRFRDGP